MSSVEYLTTTVTGIIREQLLLNQRVRVQVTGSSMKPLMHKGDAVIVEHAAPETLAPGDIVMYQHQGTHCTHRFVCMRRHTMITKGDGWKHFDAPVHADQLSGRVCLLEKKGRTIRLNQGAIRHYFGALLQAQWHVLNSGFFNNRVTRKITCIIFHPVNQVFSYLISRKV